MDEARIKARINRLIGQLKGVERMIAGRRSCEDIILQLTSIKKAINGLSKEIIISDVCSIVEEGKQGEVKKALERVVDL